jgi:non-ribosomal peptide synthetase component F
MYRSRESSLFDSIMVFGGNSLMDDLLKKVSEDFEIRNLGVLEGSHYPLSILVDPGEELVFRIVYDQQRFDQETMTRIGKHLETMLEAIVADPDRPLSAYSLLTSEEKQRLVVEFNQTANQFPKGKTVVHLFEQQVEETPNSAALRYGDQTISYAELNRRSNQLANYLANYGLGRGQVVALCLERSPEVIIAILGTLKAGAAYLPLDASLPAKRLALMLEETEAPMPMLKLSTSILAGQLFYLSQAIMTPCRCQHPMIWLTSFTLLAPLVYQKVPWFATTIYLTTSIGHEDFIYRGIDTTSLYFHLSHSI